jgi:hypothetical protein
MALIVAAFVFVIAVIALPRQASGWLDWTACILAFGGLMGVADLTTLEDIYG